jgi:hypothetical protein
MCSGTVPLKVQPDDPITVVFDDLEMWDGVPVEQQSVFFAGRQIAYDDSCTIREAGLQHRSTLHLTVRGLRGGGGMRIFVNTATGKKITITVASTDSVQTIKTRIQDQECITTSDRYLSFNGNQLEDDRTLVQYGIRANATLQLIAKTKYGIRANAPHQLIAKTKRGEIRIFIKMFMGYICLQKSIDSI